MGSELAPSRKRGLALKQKRADELAEANYRILKRSYGDLERLDDADLPFRDVTVRTKVAMKMVEIHQGAVRADKDAGVVNHGTMNVAIVVNRIEDAGEWEAQAAAVEAGANIISEPIDVEAEEVDEDEEWVDDVD